MPQDLTALRTSYKNVQKALTSKTPGIEVAINQVLFSDKNRPVNNDYSNILDVFYGGDQLPVNFFNQAGAIREINQYVSKKTGGKINNAVGPDDLRSTQLLLISSLFFQGKWKVCSIYYDCDS